MALKLDPTNFELVEQLFESRLALGEFAELDAELRQKIVANPKDYESTTHYMLVLAAKNDPAALRRFAKDMRSKSAAKPDDEKFWSDSYESLTAYLLGEMNTLKQTPTDMQLAYLLETGKLDAAATAANAESDNDVSTLVVGLAYAAAGNAAKHDEFRQKALNHMAATNPGGAQMAKLMQSPTAPNVDDVVDADVQSTEKVLCLIEFAEKFPAQKDGYLKLAKTLNVNRNFPYRQIQQAIEAQSHK